MEKQLEKWAEKSKHEAVKAQKLNHGEIEEPFFLGDMDSIIVVSSPDDSQESIIVKIQ